jgi:hypothetical protein
MANPNTATQTAASVVDEAVRIAADNSRRSTESAQAALQAGRKYFDHVAQVNRDLFALYTAGLDVGVKTVVDYQNAVLANTQALFETSAGLSKDTLHRYTELAQQAQATTLKTFQANARFFESATTPA